MKASKKAWTEVERIARRDKHGVIRREDALQAGLTAAQVDRRVRRGQWVSGPNRTTLILSERAKDPISVLAAATDHGESVAWSESALGLWGIGENPLRPTVATTKRRRNAALDIVYIKNLQELPLTQRLGIPTATLELALASVAADFRKREVDEFIDESIRRRLTTWKRVEKVLRLFATKGRPGSAALQRILAERAKDAAVPLSAWGRDFANKLVASGLPTPLMEHRVMSSRGRLIAQVDLAYPEHCYAIELDSLEHHFFNDEAFETDRRRDVELGARGWRVGRFTWKQYTEEWDWIVSSIWAQIGPGLKKSA